MAQSWPARRLAEPALLAGALAALYLLLQPLTADHAAQEFRAELFAREGLASWNNLWFAGHHLPGYSVLSPALGALIGPRLVGAISAVAAACLFAAVAKRHWGEDARVGILWFAAGTSISLFTGRTTFALGVAVALGAVLAAQRGYRVVSLGLAALCPLASPVAALFLGGGGLAYSIAERRRQGIELAAVAVGVAVLVSLAFPEGGSEPFVSESFTPAILLAVAVFVALPRDERLLRTGVVVYGAALIAAFLVDNPLGGNATRIGALLLGPVAACTLWRRDRVALALLVPLLVYWQWSPVVRDLEQVYADPSVSAHYYKPLRSYLASATGNKPTRVEVLPMANHWEAAHVPERISIARGWERQLDRKLNPLFYDERLRAGEYRRWLDELAISYVAVPRAPVDYAAESEAKLIKREPSYLRPVFRSRNWDVYRVRDAKPLATAPGEMVRLSPDGFVVRVRRPGTSLVRIHHTPYWSVTGGIACVSDSRQGFTRLRAMRSGRVEVSASFAPWRSLGDGRSCRKEP